MPKWMNFLMSRGKLHVEHKNECMTQITMTVYKSIRYEKNLKKKKSF